jgi:ubiquinone/menaquinone biosynthesis C-methylase UbiE
MPRVLLQALFRLLYTRLAWAYDHAAWLASAGHWYRWVEACLPYVEGDNLLEIGCGKGHLLHELAGRGSRVVGVDYSEAMCRTARARSDQPVLRADGRRLPFEDGRFDTIITTFPAPYITEAETQVEVARVLKAGGQWLWVDVPMLQPRRGSRLSWLVNRVAYGEVPPVPPLFARDATGGLWDITIERVTAGSTSIAVRRARLAAPSEQQAYRADFRIPNISDP